MSSDSSILKCEHCDYKTNRPYNLKRHMVTKHSAQNVSIFTPKVSISAPKVSLFAPNVSISAQNVSIERTHTKQCEKCLKVYKKRVNYINHISNCKGPNYDPLVCECCLKRFVFATSKYRHLKVCRYADHSI